MKYIDWCTQDVNIVKRLTQQLQLQLQGKLELQQATLFNLFQQPKPASPFQRPLTQIAHILYKFMCPLVRRGHEECRVSRFGLLRRELSTSDLEYLEQNMGSYRGSCCILAKKAQGIYSEGMRCQGTLVTNQAAERCSEPRPPPLPQRLCWS